MQADILRAVARGAPGAPDQPWEAVIAAAERAPASRVPGSLRHSEESWGRLPPSEPITPAAVLVAVIVFSVLSMTVFALLFFSVSVLHFRDMQAAAGRKGQVEQLVALPQLLDRISDRSTLGFSDGFVLEADNIAGR